LVGGRQDSLAKKTGLERQRAGRGEKQTFNETGSKTAQNERTLLENILGSDFDE